MTTCKDCAHYDVCEEIENLSCRSQFRWYLAVSGCPHFKDKSKIIELPCKVGDTFFRIMKDCEKCGKYHIDEDWGYQRCNYDWDELPSAEQSTFDDISRIGKHCCLYIEEIIVSSVEIAFNLIKHIEKGKTVFLTKEEAEQRLAEVQK